VRRRFPYPIADLRRRLAAGIGKIANLAWRTAHIGHQATDSIPDWRSSHPNAPPTVDDRRFGMEIGVAPIHEKHSYRRSCDAPGSGWLPTSVSIAA
jgi:hypothetical protein